MDSTTYLRVYDYLAPSSCIPSGDPGGMVDLLATWKISDGLRPIQHAIQCPFHTPRRHSVYERGKRF